MNKKQNKKRKTTSSYKKNFLFKSFGLGTILLTAFSVFSSGFSSWVFVKEGLESINGNIEVEDTLGISTFINIDETLVRPLVEITPNGLVIDDETIENDTYEFMFDAPFAFTLDYEKLYPFLTNLNEVNLKVTLKNKIVKVGTTNFRLFQNIYLSSNVSVIATPSVDLVGLNKETGKYDGVFSDGYSFVTTITFEKPELTADNKSIRFEVGYLFDFSAYSTDPAVFTAHIYNEFPEDNPFQFIFEVGMSI